MSSHHRYCPAYTDVRKACRCMTLHGTEDDLRRDIADRVRALPTMGNGGDDAMLYRSAVLDAIRNAP